jgi:NTE family protein
MRDPAEIRRADPGLARYLPKIVYVLSGGAAKGFCHLGIIEALEKRDIRPDLIVGTSAGALFGALYSHFGNVGGVRGRIEEVLASDEFALFEKKYFGDRKPLDGRVERGLKRFFSGFSGALKNGVHLGMALVTSAMVAEKDAASIFGRIFEGITFETLKIPFAAVAVDLSEGVPVIFTDGKGHGKQEVSRTIAGADGLMKAVMASSAIPLIFPAVQIEDHPYADGCIMANLPVREARALLPGEQLLLAGFDVSPPVVQPEEELSSVELVLRLLDLATRSKQYADGELADVLFTPVDKEYPWSSFANYKEFLDLGRRYMTEDRLAGFERIYREKCFASVGRDRNVLRRFGASARLRRLVGQP